MDRIINMIIRQVVSQLVNRGMHAGINKLTQGRADATPKQQAQARHTGDRAKQAIRLIRRFGRF